MGTTGTDGGSASEGGDESRWKIAMIPQYASATLALAALVVSFLAMLWQTGIAKEQTRLTAEQKELAKDQSVLEQAQAKEESLPKVSSWLLPAVQGSAANAYLYIVNKDKDALTKFYVEVRDQRASLDFVPPCTRTIIPLSREQVEVFASDTDGWLAYFQSADTWWTFDGALRVIKGAQPTGEAEAVSLAGAQFFSEPDCET